MNKFVLKVCTLIFVTLTISACVGGPIGYGGSYKIVHSDENQIMFEYDSDIAGIDTMMTVAKEHCRKFGEKAVPGQPSAPNWNAVATFMATCNP